MEGVGGLEDLEHSCERCTEHVMFESCRGGVASTYEHSELVTCDHRLLGWVWQDSKSF